MKRSYVGVVSTPNAREIEGGVGTRDKAAVRTDQ
eukprot:CAMPEP_0184502726 /NCGR_PEP_ID=MMETSP0113_2-20130426/51097_1 /TAXON_ID=91329 /ORGANISM="Norrisiella sphaerica, Strain BC52" /LENGTH=33 /DNA_ID= /DNA_START= /DNA_END= /DNA_ORIENTATION=